MANVVKVMERKKKIPSLQIIRAFVFLGIFTSHCNASELGAWGVSVFVILSGFVMFYSYCDKQIDISIKGCYGFAIKKIKKLYILHILTMSAALLIEIYYLINNFSLKHTFALIVKVFLNIMLLQSWIPSSNIYFSLNSVAWYLSVCLFIYFTFPWILAKLKKITKCCIAVKYILMIYIIQIIVGITVSRINISLSFIDDFSKWVTYISPIFRTGDFIIGCLLGYIYLNIKRDIKAYKASLLELSAVIAVFAAQYFFSNKFGYFSFECFKYNMLYTPSSCLLIFIFAINRGIISRLLSQKFIIFLGNISAYTFLLHQILIKYFDKLIFGDNTNIWMKAAIMLIVTIICSYLYMLYEKYIRLRKS